MEQMQRMAKNTLSRVTAMNYHYEITRNFGAAEEGYKLIIKEFEGENYHGWRFVDKLIEIKKNPNQMFFQKQTALRMLNWLQEHHPELLL